MLFIIKLNLAVKNVKEIIIYGKIVLKFIFGAKNEENNEFFRDIFFSKLY